MCLGVQEKVGVEDERTVWIVKVVGMCERRMRIYVRVLAGGCVREKGLYRAVRGGHVFSSKPKKIGVKNV